MSDNSFSSLPGTVQPAAPGLKGFDIDAVISPGLAKLFKSNGYAFCGRYLSLGEGQAPGDLTNEEAAGILNAGLALIAVQHVVSESWAPDQGIGSRYGANAAANAASIGLPQGMNLWCDLEGVAAGTGAQAVIDYCNAWYAAVYNAGYVPGIYVGASCVLSGQQLYDLPFQHYWKSASEVPAVEPRGYQLVQGLPVPVFGTEIDPDTTQNDSQGGTVLWLAR